MIYRSYQANCVLFTKVLRFVFSIKQIYSRCNYCTGTMQQAKRRLSDKQLKKGITFLQKSNDYRGKFVSLRLCVGISHKGLLLLMYRQLNMKKGLTLLAALLALVSCGSLKKEKAGDSEQDQKSLVIYYSQTGATRQVATEIAQELGADTLRIEAEEPYSGTYEETIARTQKEMVSGTLPKLKELGVDISKYDTIFLGYPIWFGTYARPIAALVKEQQFAGKTIVPFCTFGSGGLAASTEDLKKALPEAKILEGYGVRNARVAKAPAEIDRFLKAGGFIKGEVEKLPDYSAQQPVTDEEKAIFDAACGDYQYPLGTPVSVGKRSTAEGTDYRFISKSKDMQGKDTETTIYVTVSKEAGAKPEFTEVVR